MNFKFHKNLFTLEETDSETDYDISAESLDEAIKTWNENKLKELNLQNIKYVSIIASSFIFIFTDDDKAAGNISEFAYNNGPHEIFKKIEKMTHLISDPLFEEKLFRQDMYDNLRLTEFSGPNDLRFRTGPIAAISVEVDESTIFKYKDIINKDEDGLLKMLLQIKKYIRNREFINKSLNEDFLRRYKLLSDEEKDKLKELPEMREFEETFSIN